MKTALMQDRTHVLERLKRLKCLRDVPGYFSFAAGILLSVLSLGCLDSNTHDCHLFVGKDIVT